jgi:hypothetical protein
LCVQSRPNRCRSCGGWAGGSELLLAAPRKSGAMPRYRLKTSIAAIYDKLGDSLVRVTLPAGALLTESSQPSGTVIGMIGVYWEGRHYSVHLRDLLRNGERVQSA